MTSREKILGTIKSNQPPLQELPEERPFEKRTREGAGDLAAAFTTMLEGIGGSVYFVSGYDRIAAILHEQHPDARRIVSGCPELGSFGEVSAHYDDPHTLENVDLAVLRAHFGVAENGACWMTEDQMIERALPFIAAGDYGFATFIAGPSKTADIEQSLVLGAHGPRSLIVFLLDEGVSDAGFY
jgi:L-lactate dehydrogenase complex protein LldG